MKRKFAFMLLALIVMPVFALFGCEEVASYPVLVYSSSMLYGSVAGNGTYKDGQEVSLTASAKKGSHFICWVYENTSIVNDEHIFTITNELDSQEKPIKSTLTFTVSASTKGTYTAIFEEEKMMYTKLTDFMVTTDPTSPPIEDNDGIPELCKANIDISQYQSASSPETVFSETDFTLKNNVIYSPEDVNQVLKMSIEAQQHININLKMTFPNEDPAAGEDQQFKTYSYSFKVDLGYRTITTEPVHVTMVSKPYSYVIGYANGIYEIDIAFNHEGTLFTFALIYRDLALPTPSAE
ncbi:MAG: hypothetical protein J6J24_00765 [Clostridia bacterium]|nr:hypothetical protein [Clostridia bacterium]